MRMVSNSELARANRDDRLSDLLNFREYFFWLYIVGFFGYIYIIYKSVDVLIIGNIDHIDLGQWLAS